MRFITAGFALATVVVRVCVRQSEEGSTLSGRALLGRAVQVPYSRPAYVAVRSQEAVERLFGDSLSQRFWLQLLPFSLQAGKVQ